MTSSLWSQSSCMAASAVVLTACSFIFVDGPYGKTSRGDASKTSCTSSLDAPVADTVIGVLAAVGAVAGLTAGRRGCTSQGWDCFGASFDQAIAQGAGAVGALFSLIQLPSAIYGYVKTSACRSQTVAPSASPSNRSTESPPSRAKQGDEKWSPF